MSGQPTILIVGAGLAGSLLAVMLAREGFRVRVFERRPDPRRKGYVGGRSINLALSARGIDALAAAGLSERVMARDAIPMRGRMMHSPEGRLTFQPYSANPADAINSVSRGGLNLTLLEAAAEHEHVELAFDQCCVDVDLASSRPAAVFSPVQGGGLPATGAATTRVEADLILAADGAFSPVRAAMQRTDRFDYSQSYLGHGYKELHIPARAGGSGAEHALDPGALHIWPRSSAMMIALPNRDGSFTCTLFWPMRGEHGLETPRTDEEVRGFFERHYADAAALMPTLVEDFRRNPSSSLVTVRCLPWRVGGRVCLLGDAAHAIVPFYGQGMNCAFEDCKALVECLRRHGASGRGAAGKGGATLGDAAGALEEFERLRKPNADAIAEMAIENFEEMRDKVGSAAFLYRKRVEQALHRIDPQGCEPQYHLVSFSTVPYAEARRRGRALEGLYDLVVAELPVGSAASLGDEAWAERVRAVHAAWRRGEGAAAETAGRAVGGPIIDISPALSPEIAVWPGDTPLSREVLCDLSAGANITLSTMRSTVHLGAHADGPNHYAAGGRSVGEQRLEHYLGACHVVEARVRRGERIEARDLGVAPEQIRHPRVLLKTGTFPDPRAWNEDFAGLSVGLIDALAARGVITIGIDTPSVDVFSSKDLPAHHAIARHDLAILEGLVLRDVTPGEYELSALPLRLMGFDASPVRAVLRRLG
ncbi:MAG: FAD-dependent monooxygenase [Phycisphaerales bacterium]